MLSVCNPNSFTANHASRRRGDKMEKGQRK